MVQMMITINHLSKRFNHVVALDGVSIEVQKGIVTAIVGDNGSGKSTLIHILSGNLLADEGSISLDGIEVRILSPQKAIQLGIRTVYQDLSLDNFKNATENIFLGEELMAGLFLARKKMVSQARELLKRINIQIPDLTEAVGNLSGGQRQGVAIARALLKPSNLLILDEPTSAMGVHETESVFHVLRTFKAEQKTMLLISHDLFRVFELADRIYILKSGCCIADVQTKDTSPEQVYQMIKGE